MHGIMLLEFSGCAGEEWNLIITSSQICGAHSQNKALQQARHLCCTKRWYKHRCNTSAEHLSMIQVFVGLNFISYSQFRLARIGQIYYLIHYRRSCIIMKYIIKSRHTLGTIKLLTNKTTWTGLLCTSIGTRLSSSRSSWSGKRMNVAAMCRKKEQKFRV